MPLNGYRSPLTCHAVLQAAGVRLPHVTGRSGCQPDASVTHY